ncbi:MAG TPA: hemerythrin family protein [Anaeromyxobacteraceae bacterium]|nr:hemerythrin family protein [Anaeromyxobacteraceae bacterium]
MERTWNSGLEGGGRTVDDEHRLQLDLLDAVDELVRRGADPALARRSLQQLTELSEAHFRSEELLMELYRYARREAHAEEHRGFSQRLEEIRDRLAAGDASRAAEAIGSWRSSLVEHIRAADLDFARSERGLKYARSL